MKTILFFLLFFSCKALYGVHPYAIWLNHKGLVAIHKENPVKAKETLYNAAQVFPKDERLHMNLGLAYLLSEDLDRSLAEFLTVLLLTEDRDVEFFAHFNAAFVYGLRGDIEAALQHYQRALQLRPKPPESIQVKTNIELLMKLMSADDGEGEGEEDPENGDDAGTGKELINPTDVPDEARNLDDFEKERILEEIRNQEEEIRRNFFNEETRSEPRRGKEW